MCPARIECPNGYQFTLEGEKMLDDRIPEFVNLTKKDRDDLEWRSIISFVNGFQVVLYGRQDVIIDVTPSSVTSRPEGYEKQIRLGRNNILTLGGGTKIVPI